MHHQRVRTYGPHQVVTDIGVQPNRQLELVEFEVFDFLGQKVHVFYLDQAAAATHAEQVNVALREVVGGELVATAIRDQYRLVADDVATGRPVQLGYAVADADVQRRCLTAMDRSEHVDPRIQVQTVVEHPWRDFERAPEKAAA